VAAGTLLAPAPAEAEQDLAAHFARELHDQVAQPLVELVLEIRELRTVDAMDNSTELAMSRVEESARRVLRQAREMLLDLRGPHDLQLDFGKALRSELRRGWWGGAAPNVHVTSRWPKHINGWAASNLLRIAQEAVTNAVRHGRAGKIDVFLDTSPDNDAVMVIIDDGFGIGDAPTGFGMVGMTERAVILGGTFKAAARETGGTRVEVRVPMHRLG
jgi:two-component system sensor histidine kinase UhpB